MVRARPTFRVVSIVPGKLYVDAAIGGRLIRKVLVDTGVYVTACGLL